METMEIQKIRTFTNGYVMSVRLGDDKLIETTNTFLPISTELRGFRNRLSNEILEESNLDDISKYWRDKNMIGISTQSGCPVMCKFCEVNKVTRKYGWRNLTDEEMLNQVELAINTTNRLYGLNLYNEDPKSFKILRILFTRMGEPALNIHNVVSAIRKLKIKFKEYPLRVQISTIGIKESERLVDELIQLESEFDENFIELQFSIHSTDNEFRRWLQTPSILTNEEINKLAEKFYFSRKHDWKVTLNFTLTNKTPFDINVLKRQFNPDAVFIKLSPLNETETSKENDLYSRFKNYNKI